MIVIIRDFVEQKVIRLGDYNLREFRNFYLLLIQQKNMHSNHRHLRKVDCLRQISWQKIHFSKSVSSGRKIGQAG